ncbi:MAG TPA: sigma 54-interacting transcriptional regulator, partial [bacterium]|nr:sigma 54-interacting transcriptional regulator [bacterium]
SGNGDPYSGVREWLRAAPPRPVVLIFCDVQEWEPKDREALRPFLAGLARSRLPWTVLLEGGDDVVSEGDFTVEALALKDLSKDETLSLIEAADPERRITAPRALKIAEESGGRPLLVLEALAAGERTKANFEAVCAARVSGLTPPARDLLAAVCSHGAAVPLVDAAAVFGAESSFEDALMELDQKDFLADRAPEKPLLKLAHPALRSAFVAALGAETTAAAHARWIDVLEPRVAAGGSGDALIALAEHAFASEDRARLKAWGLRAVERQVALGRNREAVAWLEKLLPDAGTPEERVQVNGHLAPLYLRLGRFEESVKAYGRWFADRADDETRLQRLKHRYYTGLVFFTWGKSAEARQRLEEAVAAEDGEAPAAHRPYLTRARCALAALSEKENLWEEARGHLERALRQAGDDAALRGEVEQLFGKIDQRDFQYASAVLHFQKAREHYGRAGDARAEAAALHAEGMAHRDAGNLSRAFECVYAAANAARAHGDVLQWARYSENLGVVFLDAADYGAAKETFEDARDVLEALARPEDREEAALVRADFALRVGRVDRCRAILAKLLSQRPFHGPGTRFSIELLTAEMHYARGDYEKSREVFELAAHDLDKHPEGQPIFGLQAGLGVCRSLAAQGRLTAEHPAFRKTLALLDVLSGDVFEVWKRAFVFFTTPTGSIAEKDARDLMTLVRRISLPEVRADLYRLLAADLARRGAPQSAADLRIAYENELRAIHATLPEENFMDFEKTRTFRPVEPVPSGSAPAPAAGPAPGSISEARFRQYGQINRYICQNRPLDDILERVMDAAIELTGAERGFLLLRREGASEEGPLPGFEVKSARHLSRRGLKQKEFQLSLSAIRKSVDGGTYLLTDDAQLDPRLKTQQSVMIHQLKSILVMPMELEDEAVGVIYLDHPFRQGCFSHESVLLLSALASQAALAVQKAELLVALRKSQAGLEAKVEDQTRRIEAITEELARAREDLRFGYEGIVGKSPAIVKVFELLDHVTDTAIPVWIWGESGTGKELVARALHFNSPRKGKPFIAENVGAIPETLLESELFGHKKGSFTHADRDRVGLFEQAGGGTLFLDEIADMSPALQAKLLRVLQEGEVRPVGSSKTVKVDVRLVTASNRDLNRLVSEGKFRQDLFFRINGLTVRLPPLRERKEDIPLLAGHFSKKFSKELGLPEADIGEAAMRLLIQHPWPGNIRELEGVIRTASVFAKGKTIQPEHLNLGLSSFPTPGAEPSSGKAAKTEEASAERQMILQALKETSLDKEAAARKLGMGLRTLYTRMGRLGIPKKKTLLARYVT